MRHLGQAMSARLEDVPGMPTAAGKRSLEVDGMLTSRLIMQGRPIAAPGQGADTLRCLSFGGISRVRELRTVRLDAVRSHG